VDVLFSQGLQVSETKSLCAYLPHVLESVSGGERNEFLFGYKFAKVDVLEDFLYGSRENLGHCDFKDSTLGCLFIGRVNVFMKPGKDVHEGVTTLQNKLEYIWLPLYR
jgi:hypothetical protein